MVMVDFRPWGIETRGAFSHSSPRTSAANQIQGSSEIFPEMGDEEVMLLGRISMQNAKEPFSGSTYESPRGLRKLSSSDLM